MMQPIRSGLSSPSLSRRIITAGSISLLLYVGVTVLAYVALPDGFLRGRNPLQGWDESESTLILAGQIFVFNLISVVIIALASLFGSRKEGESNYFSTGYVVYFTLITLNAVTLGTWSFSIESEAPSLLDRLLGMADITARSGLWEMVGQMVTTCALAHIALVRTTGRATLTRNFRDVRVPKPERIAVFIGLVLMLAGAIIEGIAINR